MFGLNNYNQIGLKSTVPQFLPKLSEDFSNYSWKTIASAQHHTVALDDNGKVYAIGRKEYGRLGLGKDCEDATKLQLITFLEEKKSLMLPADRPLRLQSLMRVRKFLK